MDTEYRKIIERFADRVRELSDEELCACAYVHAGRYSDEDMQCAWFW